MEREINSTFYDRSFDVSLLVVETKLYNCKGCFYDEGKRSFGCKDKHGISGRCGSRNDGKSVIFKHQGMITSKHEILKIGK